MEPERSVEIAVVGGGPAGAAVATRLSSVGHEVALFERWPQPRWRASGVYTSPLTRRRLRELGLDDDALTGLIRPISSLVVETTGGATCRLDYEASGYAGGVDRVRIERAMLDLARARGADVQEGAVVRAIQPSVGGSAGVRGSLLDVSTATGAQRWRARLVVGADGPGSLVARSFDVAQRARWLRRAGLTVHRVDPDALPEGSAMDGRMLIGRGWYCGVAPVPGRRVNIGIVMSVGSLRQRLASGASAAAIVDSVVVGLPGPADGWRTAESSDAVCVAVPLAHRVARRAGPLFVLVGDAAGFVDPLSGEGLDRALVSAEFAAEAVTAGLRRGTASALERYDRRMRARTAPKDLISWLLQAFLSQPAVLDHAVRRLAARPELRETFAAVMADLEPAGRALDLRYLAALLRP